MPTQQARARTEVIGMSISSVQSGGPAWLVSGLEQAGLSSSLAGTAASEFKTAIEQSSSAGSGQRLDPSQIQTALSKQLATDVSSGKITQAQSDQITHAFQSLQQNGPPGGAGGPPPGGPPPGGGAHHGHHHGSGAGSATDGSTLSQLLQTIGATAGGTGSTSSGGSGTTDTASYLSGLLSQSLVSTTA